MPGWLSDRVRQNNNEFWWSARSLHLDALLEAAYRDPGKRDLVRRWLRDGGVRRVLLRQLDFDSDPLVIELTQPHFDNSSLRDRAVPICSNQVRQVRHIVQHIGIAKTGKEHLGIICER